MYQCNQYHTDRCFTNYLSSAKLFSYYKNSILSSTVSISVVSASAHDEYDDTANLVATTASEGDQWHSQRLPYRGHR